MKKLFYWAVPMKSLSAMIFAGLIILYIIAGTAYAFITNESFEYAIPFIFVIQAAALSIIISVIATIIFSDILIKKKRYFYRLIIFSITLLPVFAICFLVFSVIYWTNLWLIIGGLTVIGLIIIALLLEYYFKLRGRQYTEILKDYKLNIE